MEDPWWELREQPFHSDKPVLGRLIVWFRTLWNNVATRWYVVPLLQQQTAINHRLQSEIVELQAEIANLREELTIEQELRRALDEELATTRRDQAAALYAMQAEIERLQPCLQMFEQRTTVAV
jgi:uncharacterized protein YlxW (UPF0749 family)